MYNNKFFTDENSSSSEDDEQQISDQTVNPDVFLVSYKAGNGNEVDVKRVVRSEKDKRYEEIQEVIEKIQQAIPLRNITLVYEYFDNLIKVYDKARRVIEKEPKIPRFYIEILLQLNNFVNQCWNDRDWCNKLNKIDSNNLNIFNQKLRRYLKQEQFQNEINEGSSTDENDSNQEGGLQDISVVTALGNEEILKKLDEIISMRGKRGINYQNQLESLNILRAHVEQQNFDIEIVIKILLIQITINFDYLQKGNNHFKLDTWIRILDYIEELIRLLMENVNLKVTFYDDLISNILQMDEEFIKILQNTDHHSQDYIERLKDESRICSILDQLKNYFELNSTTVQSEHLCTIYLCIIEHIYYKYDQSSIKLIDRLCKYIYTNDTSDRGRVRASLCHIYHLALHDYYNEARNLMLMCHIQDTIHSSDISTQILYNRTMVQLGLCAFRFGKIHEAHQALVDIQSGHRIKELLGEECLPYHMHINLELIESIYLISAMIIEIPSRRKHLISRHFYIVMKQEIFGPPESMREHIVAASHAMKTGDWKTCVDFLVNEKMNNKIWKLIPQATEVIEMLIKQIKEESLRIYLFIYATVFSGISIPTLAEMFELPIKQIYGIISKMIINKELMASIEESNQIVIMEETNSSKIQDLSNE